MAANPTLAFAGQQAVTLADLRPALLESAGGQVLAEWVIDRGITQRLAERGIKLTPADLDAERDILLTALAVGKDQALRVLAQLRAVRGLGEARFAAMLQRNAGLRRLVRDEAPVADAEVRQEYDLEYGPKCDVRLIVTSTLSRAAETVRQARAGVSFIDLALAHSTDSSRAQGGLLTSVSLADPTYPQAVRLALSKLKEGEISDPVSLERGFAVLKLERKIEAAKVKFDDVKEALRERVQRRAQRLAMDRVVRQIVSQTNLTILDPGLEKSYQEHRKLILGE